MTDVETLELVIPAEPEYVGAARLFVAAVGRHFELGEESVADVKVAVSEVCSGAAEDSEARGALRIEIRVALEGLEVDVDPHGSPPSEQASKRRNEYTPDPLDDDFREGLVRALFPNAIYRPGSHSLRIRVPWELPEDIDGPERA